MHVRSAAAVLVLLALATGAAAQLVVFDHSHGEPYDFSDAFRARLAAWGFAVEQRTTPLMGDGDADVIVVLPEDAYNLGTSPYTAQEAQWLRDFVDGGGGLLAGICPDDAYWAQITELMDLFGIADGNTRTEPVLYDQFAAHPIFQGVGRLGDDYIHCTSLIASPPSVAVGGDGSHDFIAVYEPAGGTGGGAVWLSHYYMLHAEGLDDYDNLVFLRNVVEWMTGELVANRGATWGEVKALFR